MKVRIKFTKTGPLKYIGHLDVMRFFQKLNRRAGIPAAYSEGFSPHQILSFSPPLPLGAESYGEYADLTITDKISSEAAIEALNENTVEGISIISFKELPDNALNAMASVTAASYRCRIKDSICYEGNIVSEIKDLINQDEINVLKVSKKNEKMVDIKPLIYDISVFDPEKEIIDMTLSAGSVDNLKPELIYKAVFDKTGFSCDERFLDIIRLDLYTGDSNLLVSLDDVGRIIP